MVREVDQRAKGEVREGEAAVEQPDVQGTRVHCSQQIIVFNHDRSQASRWGKQVEIHLSAELVSRIVGCG